ncbi:methionine synthase [Nocardioides salsibiostraticola]
MTAASGVGSLPGSDQRAYSEWLRVVLGEFAEPPHVAFLPEVPGRGVAAGMIGRTLGLITEVGIDLQPAGWRMTDAAGVDHRRARSLLAQDLDGLEELAQEREGVFKVQIAGPWTLAATVEKPRGDKVLSDVGARRDLAQSLSLAVGEHVADLRRRLPSADRLIVQVDEPALAAVLAGKVPTASGFGRHRTVHPPEASETLTGLFDAITAAGAHPWVHSCADDAPLDLLRGAGATGLAVDLDRIGAAGHNVLAEALDAGEWVMLGVLPSADDVTAPDDSAVVARVLRWLDSLGLDMAEVGERLVVSSSCGLAGATGSAKSLLNQAHRVADHLS